MIYDPYVDVDSKATNEPLPQKANGNVSLSSAKAGSNEPRLPNVTHSMPPRSGTKIEEQQAEDRFGKHPATRLGLNDTVPALWGSEHSYGTCDYSTTQMIQWN